MPKPTVLEEGEDGVLPSGEKGREIPVRVFRPNVGRGKGVFYHIHGGGWVLQSEAYQVRRVQEFWVVRSAVANEDSKSPVSGVD